MQSWSTDDFQDSCRKLGPHNAYPLPPRTKLAWLFSSCNKSNVPGIIPRRQRQPGFTPLQPTRMSVRGSVSQTHTPFISPSSPMGAILWVKQRNSLQVSCSSLLSISRLLLKRKIKQWLAMGTQAQFCWSGTQRGVILTNGAALAIIPCADMVIPAIYCCFFFCKHKDNLLCRMSVPIFRCILSCTFWEYKAGLCPDEEAASERNSLCCLILGRHSLHSQGLGVLEYMNMTFIPWNISKQLSEQIRGREVKAWFLEV